MNAMATTPLTGPPTGIPSPGPARSGDLPLRDPAVVCDPQRLGAVRLTRHSFTASLLRRAAACRWQVRLPRWRLDIRGRGDACYEVHAEGHVFCFVVFSQVLDENERTDRVIASRWDVTAALVDGPVDERRLRVIREQVTRQEDGRADPSTLVWTRGNRSSRFFDHVVDRLAGGSQPDSTELGLSPYVLRSTAYYANGKFGMAPFEALASRGPLATPYRAQMLAAWLFREFSCDLVEHLAAARSARATPLSPAWRRHLGIGNATGLGMVPFVVNHPAILNAWCLAREVPLAVMRVNGRDTAQPQSAVLEAALRGAAAYFWQRADEPYEPFQDGGSLATEVERFASRVAVVSGHARPWDSLWKWAEDHSGLEAREVLASCLTDLDDGCDEIAERLLTVDDHPVSCGGLTAGQMRDDIEQRYQWALRLAREQGASAYFWYYSRESEEPRRGRSGTDPGEHVAMTVTAARDVERLREALRIADPAMPVAALLLGRPKLRSAAQRVAATRRLPFGEAHDNLCAERFLPLQLQRFQLATYGAENFLPQSTDWVRVTLMQGAFSWRDLPALTRWHHPLFPTAPQHDSEITS